MHYKKPLSRPIHLWNACRKKYAGYPWTLWLELRDILRQPASFIIAVDSFPDQNSDQIWDKLLASRSANLHLKRSCDKYGKLNAFSLLSKVSLIIEPNFFSPQFFPDRSFGIDPEYKLISPVFSFSHIELSNFEFRTQFRQKVESWVEVWK